MGYSKTTWADRNVQYPNRYTDELSNTKTFIPSPGTITEAGTKATASRMNNIESGIESAHKGTHIYGASAVGTDSYAITFAPSFSAYNAGMIVNMKADVSNTGSATINVDGLGAKSIKKIISSGKTDVTTGDIIANGIYTFIYDGTDFILTSPTAILNSLMTTQGDMIYASGANTSARLAVGTSGKAIISDGTNPVYGYPDYKTYVASDSVLLTLNTEQSNNTNTFSNVKQFKVKYNGTIRIKFDIKKYGGSYNGTININNYSARKDPNSSNLDRGLLIGSYISSATNYESVSIDVDTNSIKAGDLIYIYIAYAYIRNMTVCGTESVATSAVIVD